MSYNIGDDVELTAQTSVQGVLTDPTAITLTVTDPLGDVYTYNWPSPSTLVRVSQGSFSLDFSPNISGLWSFEWSSTGAVVTDGKGALVVAPVLRSVTLSVTNGSTALPGVNAIVYSPDGVTIVGGGKTDSNGHMLVVLPPLVTYSVELSMDGYALLVSSFTPADASSQTFSFSLTSLGIVAPTPPASVLLFGYAASDGASRTRVVIETYAGSVAAGATDTGIDPLNVMIPPSKREVFTSPTAGYWATQVLAGARVRVAIPAFGFEKFFRVPDDGTLSLNIRDARPDPGPAGFMGVTSDVVPRNGAL